MERIARSTYCISNLSVLSPRSLLFGCLGIPVLDETGVMVNDGNNLPEDNQEKREPWYAENQTNCEEWKVNVAPRDIGAHLHIERGVTVQRPSGASGSMARVSRLRFPRWTWERKKP